MYDITIFISCLIRVAILEIPVFYGIQFIWKNFIGGLRIILILVLSLLVSGLFVCSGMLLPSEGIFYLTTKLDKIFLYPLCLLAISALCFILAIILCIYLHVKNIEYEEYDEYAEYEEYYKYEDQHNIWQTKKASILHSGNNAKQKMAGNLLTQFQPSGILNFNISYLTFYFLNLKCIILFIFSK